MKELGKIQLELGEELAEYRITETKGNVSRRGKCNPMTGTSERSRKMPSQTERSALYLATIKIQQ